MNIPETLHVMPAPRNVSRGAGPVATLYGPEPIGAAGAVPLADVFADSTAQRLALCWNACKGASDSQLVAGGPGSFLSLSLAAATARDMLQECMRTAACNDQADTIDEVLQALGAALRPFQF